MDLNKFFDYFTTAVYRKNEEGQFISCNQAYLERTGLTLAHVVGKSDTDMPWAKYAAQIRKNDLLVMQKNIGMTIKENGNVIHKVPTHNAAGEVDGIVGIYFDTEVATTKTENSLNTLEEIIAVLPGHVYWKDRNCILQGCNDAQALDAGLASRDEIVGKSAYDLLFQGQEESAKRKQAAITDAIDHAIMAANKREIVEEFTVSPTGEKVYWLSNKVPLHDKSGNVTGLVGISIDITQRVEAEEREKEAIRIVAEERANAKAEAELRSAVTILAGSIAHDLRVPLASMSIIIDLFTKFWLAFMTEHEQYIIPQNNDSWRMHLEKIDSFPIKMKKLIAEMDNFIRVTLKSMQHLVAGTLSYEDFTVCQIETCIMDAVSIYPFKEGEKKLINVRACHQLS